MMRTATLLMILSMALGLSAQSNLSLYHMKSLPQASYVNPANMPDANWFIGMPGYSSLNTDLNSSLISLSNLNSSLVPDDSGGYILDLDQLSQTLDRRMSLNASVANDWIHFGFRMGNNYLTMNITEKVKTRIDIPNDVFTLLLQGNGGDNLGRTFNLAPGLGILHTREIGVAYQRTMFGDQLRVGGRLKYVIGLNSLEFERNNIYFTTDETDFSYTVKADFKVNVATLVDPAEMFFDDSTSSSDQDALRALLFGVGNTGFGLDIGASMDITDAITVSASIVDLGFISWQNNTMNFSTDPNAEFLFRGIEIKDIILDSVDFDRRWEELGDSVAEIFAIDSARSTFTTGLLGEFYLGANLNINKDHNLGALVYGNFFNRTINPALTLSWNARFRKFLGWSVSYSMMRGNFVNLGLGLSVNTGAFQWYIITDNVVGSVTGTGMNMSLRSGINFTFGRRKYENKPSEEEPVI